jgi:glycosyltransferase involved in cell wall biosynthesis
MVVVVILNYNDADNCLRVANNALKDSNINKVIIVDNCSPDKSYERLKEHASDNLVIMQSERNGGFAYGHNVGIRYALTSYDPGRAPSKGMTLLSRHAKYFAAVVLIAEYSCTDAIRMTMISSKPSRKVIGCESWGRLAMTGLLTPSTGAAFS